MAVGADNHNDIMIIIEKPKPRGDAVGPTPGPALSRTISHVTAPPQAIVFTTRSEGGGGKERGGPMPWARIIEKSQN